MMLRNCQGGLIQYCWQCKDGVEAHILFSNRYCFPSKDISCYGLVLRCKGLDSALVKARGFVDYKAPHSSNAFTNASQPSNGATNNKQQCLDIPNSFLPMTEDAQREGVRGDFRLVTNFSYIADSTPQCRFQLQIFVDVWLRTHQVFRSSLSERGKLSLVYYFIYHTLEIKQMISKTWRVYKLSSIASFISPVWTNN